jgi:hypothetical protein
MADGDPLTFTGSQQLPGSFREPDLVFGEDFVSTLEKDRDQLMTICAEQHLRAGRKALGPAHRAISPHDDYGLALRMQIETAHPKARSLRGRLLIRMRDQAHNERPNGRR